jgi:ABC-type Fe3+-siderophore transport system permease subunit
LRNPLADPYLLGISAGASTGAVMVALLGVGAGMISLSVGAFAGAVTAFVLVILLARVSGPASALGGAVFLIAADVLSRTLIKGQVIPVGVITALVGAPVFALILVGRRSAR